MIDLSIGIVAYNNEKEIGRLLESIIKNTSGIDYKIFVIDNASTDNTVDFVKKEYPSVEVIATGENMGFGHGHNKMLGVESRYHAVVNPDISLDSNVFSDLVKYLDENPDVALVTPKIMNSDGTQQHLPKLKPTKRYMLLGRLSRYIKAFAPIREEYTMSKAVIDKPIEIEFCTGCFMVMRTELFNKIKGFDEQFFMYLEDADLTERISKYGKVIFHPDYHVTHNWEGGSSKSFKLIKIHFQSMHKYFKKQKQMNK